MRGQSLYDYCMEHEDKKYLLDEWDYEKNESELGISTKGIGLGSHKKVWWVCERGHHYTSIVGNRTRLNSGCPECAKLIRVKTRRSKSNELGIDLASRFPDLLSEWCYEKNKADFDLEPNNISFGSNKKVWWKCSICQNVFLMSISNRTHRASKCPICYKEQRTSFSEQTIYFYLKLVYENVTNSSRNLLTHGLELDIYIPEIKTAIEYDGVKWHKDIDKDLKKNKLCQENGIRLIRIREEGLSNVEGSVNIFRKDNSTDSALEEVLNELFSLLGIEVDVNIERDRQLIYSQYVQSKKENSVGVKFPEIAKEWHPTKNGNLTTENVEYGSGKKAWWICDKGHEYEMIVKNRTSHGQGCPICSNRRVLTGFNDLASQYPELAKEWNYEKNGDLTPLDVFFGSGKKVWWVCKDCGHEWESTIVNRTRGRGCPECAKKNRKS